MQNAKLYTLVGGVVGGVCLLSSITPRLFFAVFLCAGVLCLLWFSVGVKLFSNFSKSYSQKTIKIFSIVLLCGLVVGVLRTSLWMSFNHAGALSQLINKKVTLTGIVVEEPQISDTSSKIILETSGDTPKAKVLVTANRYADVSYGDQIKVSGKLMVPKPIESPEGDFAYDVYLARQNIFYTITFPTITVLQNHRGNFVREFLINIKNNFLSKIDSLFSSPQSGLLAGLLVSGRSSLSKAEQTMFTQAGLIHIVALSGFNVTIIAQGLMALLIFLPKKIRLLIGASGIIAFVVMTGFGSTVVRAGIMALLVIAAALVHRDYHVGRALFLAILFMILWNPMVVYDVSFQLSCLATFAVIFAVPQALSKYESRFKFLPEQLKIRETILSTAVIEIFLLPILLSTSGQISLVTVITNLFILPTLPVVMGFGFLATLLGYIHFFIAMPLVATTNLMLHYILFIANFFANIPFAVISTRLSQWAVVGIYIALSFWLYKLRIHKTKNTELGVSAMSSASVMTSANLERLDNFFQSHSNSSFQKKQ